MAGDAGRVLRTAGNERRTVVVSLGLDVQAQAAPENAPGTVAPVVELVRAADRPVFVAGRGARGAGPQLAEACATR